MPFCGIRALPPQDIVVRAYPVEVNRAAGPPTVQRFVRTPKGWLLLLLAGLIGAANVALPARLAWPGLAAATAAAALVDLPLLRWRRRRWVFPDGAVLTGLLVGMLMSPHEPWYVGAVCSGAAVALKYVVRTPSANVFNPAALALVVASYAFDAGHSWWGALPDLTPASSLPLLFVSGGLITWRVNKAPLVLMFLGVYYALFTFAAFAGDPAHVAEVFIAPDLHAVLFFACFILTDPPTSPTRYRDQLIYGSLVAVAAYATYELMGVVYYLLAGVLVGNVWEAGRRLMLHRQHATRRVGRAGRTVSV